MNSSQKHSHFHKKDQPVTPPKKNEAKINAVRQAFCMQEQVYSGEQGQPQHLQGRLSLHINICLSKQKQM